MAQFLRWGAGMGRKRGQHMALGDEPPIDPFVALPEVAPVAIVDIGFGTVEDEGGGGGAAELGFKGLAGGFTPGDLL